MRRFGTVTLMLFAFVVGFASTYSCGGGGSGNDSTICDPSIIPLPNAGLTESAGDPGCPSGMVLVEGFCIDKYEAHLAVVSGGGGTSPWSPYVNPATAGTVMAVSAADAVPQGYISQIQADDACAQAGKRLCTNSEWLRACQGAAGNTYPYADTLSPGTCNDTRDEHPLVSYFNTTASWIWTETDHVCINQEPDGLALTGGYPGCVSEEGAFDMVGNLHEWTSDATGVFRGGYYVESFMNGDGCLYSTTAHSTSHWDYSTGFRCCADQL